jgi:SAM-dependent methyltransferase
LNAGITTTTRLPLIMAAQSSVSRVGAPPGRGGSCPCCGSDAARRILLGFGFDDGQERFALVECRSCGVVRTHPSPGTAELERRYGADYYGSAEAKFHPLAEAWVRAENRSRARRVVRMATRGDEEASPRAVRRILDVGSGRGLFLREMGRLGWECHGTERAGYVDSPPSAFRLHRGELVELGFADAFFDAITIWHELEHVSDPAGTLREASRILRPGGLIAIAVPNFGSLQRRIFGPRWFHLDLPRHLFHLSRRSLLGLLAKNGFSPSTVGTSSLEQNLYGFVQSGLNCLFPAAHNRLYGLLKARRRAWSPAERAQAFAHLAVAVPILPLAMLENAISVLVGAGGTLIVHARKGQD